MYDDEDEIYHNESSEKNTQMPEEFTKKDKHEYDKLKKEGFKNWKLNEFNNFV